MTQKSSDPRESLYKIAELYIDGLLASSDEDILADAKKIPAAKDSGLNARTAYQAALQKLGKKRLQAAREAMNNDSAQNISTHGNVDIAKARKLIEQLAANDPKFGHKITLAARNLREIGDDEILGILSDLRRLGALPEEDQ